MPKPKDEKKIDEIYSAATHLVLKTGFSGLKMADVAKKANLATGTIYNYFKNKEDLINLLYLSMKTEISSLLTNPELIGDNFFDTFKNIWHTYFDYCFNQPEKMLFVEQFIHSGYITPDIKKQCDEKNELLTTLVAKAQEDKIIKPIPSEIIFAQLTGPVHEFIKLHLEQRICIDDKYVFHFFEMAWDSIKL